MKCPICKEATLTMAERQGVEIDYCPQCRGVWLDRGGWTRSSKNRWPMMLPLLQRIKGPRCGSLAQGGTHALTTMAITAARRSGGRTCSTSIEESGRASSGRLVSPQTDSLAAVLSTVSTSALSRP